MKKQKSLKSFEKLNKASKKLNKNSMQTIKGGTGSYRLSSVVIEQDIE